MHEFLGSPIRLMGDPMFPVLDIGLMINKAWAPFYPVKTIAGSEFKNTFSFNVLILIAFSTTSSYSQ